MTELIPCPFCKGEASVMVVGETGRYTFHHEGEPNCPARFAHYASYATEAEAIEAWNTRTGYEMEGYFYLPKPKDDVAHAVYSDIERIENGYKVNAWAEIIEENVRKWRNDLNDYLIRRMCEVWNPERTCRNISKFPSEKLQCSECGCITYFEDCESEPYMMVDGVASLPNHCPNCGAKVVD